MHPHPIQTLLRSLAVATLATCAATAQAGKPAWAGNVNLGACQLSDLSIAALDCAGYVGGNDGPTALATLIGNRWPSLSVSGLTQYKDENTSAGSTIQLFDAIKAGTDASQGSLSFLQHIGGQFIITLKGGNEVAAYLMGQGVTAGTVIRFDIPGTQGAGFSHASVYAMADGIATPVPEPETYALMLAGLVALGYVARRRA